MNAELGTNFELDGFAHRAFYNVLAGRVEMHLMSLRPQTVHLAGREIAFEEEETILTECSYKYSLAEFADLARPCRLSRAPGLDRPGAAIQRAVSNSRCLTVAV